ncbi:MAG: PD-(D/E)XK nuclease family protein [Candidatus Thermoplasmatota archaeon]|nr:PD-(D/E)XK nuclease family protein [Candidatus Thermoplasmatota archaeon]
MHSGTDTPIKADAGISVGYAHPSDGAMAMAKDLGEDLRSPGGSTYLILQSERMVKEISRDLGEAFTGRLLTVGKLAIHLYDLHGGERAVKDDDLREAMVIRIMEGMRIVHLRPEGGGIKGVAGYVSKALKELLMNRTSPADLDSIASTGRSSELCSIYREYLDILEREGMIDEEMVPDAVVRMIVDDPSITANLRFKTYMLGNMDPSYSDMMRCVLRNCSNAVCLEHPLRSCPSYLDGIHVPQSSCGAVGVPIAGTAFRDSISYDGTIHSIQGEDRISSLRCACKLIKKLIVEEELDPKDISMVTPGGDLYERFIPIIFDEYGIPFDSDPFIKLIEVPAVSGFLELISPHREGMRSEELTRALTLMNVQIGTEDENKVSGEEMDLLFREAMVFGGRDIEKDWIEPLEDHLSRPDGRYKDLCGKAIPALEWLLKRLEGLNVNGIDHRERARDIRRILSELRVCRPTAGDQEDIGHRALSMLDRAISELPSIEPGHNASLGMEEIVERLRRRVQGRKVGRETSGVWVGKIKQQTSRRARVLVVQSPVEGEVPMRPTDFRPMDSAERSALGLREHPERREELEDLAICMTTCDRVFISHHMTEGGSPVQLSPFLEALETRPYDLGEQPVGRTELLRRISSYREDASDLSGSGPAPIDPSTSLEIIDGGEEVLGRYRKRAALLDGVNCRGKGPLIDTSLLEVLERRFGPDHIWSASQLESYRKCPYDFFVRYVLGISPVEKLDPDVPPDRKGTIIHSILEGFHRRWNEKGEASLGPEKIEEAWPLMLASAREVISSYPYNGPFWDALSDLLVGAEGEKGLLREYLEKECAQTGPFSVRYTELSFGRSEPLTLSKDGGGILFGGFIDRVDSANIEGANAFRIWDYKTGSRSSFDGKRSVQVPLYSAAIRSLHEGWSAAGGGYYWVGKRGGVEREYVMGGSGKGLEYDASGSISAMERALDTALDIARSVRSGAFDTPDRCPNRTYCQFKDVCRRDEE